MDSAPNLPDGAETIETAMATLSLKSAGHIARKTLFQNLTLTLGPGDCLGLVAQNGTGRALCCVVWPAKSGSAKVRL